MPKHTSITGAVAKRLTTKLDREDHFDSSHPGLYLRVSKTGRKTWFFAYRLKNGKIAQRRMTLGLYPTTSVAGAHEAWRKARDLVQAGRDPAVADTKLPPMSFQGVFEEWLKRDQAGNKSVGRIEQRFRTRILPAWEGRLITDIDRRAALDVIDTIADSGKIILARRVFNHLHRLFVWCVGRGILETNPLQHAEKPGAERPRDRVLSDLELRHVWDKAEEQLLPSFRDALRLLVLTGARKAEISELRWDEIQGADIVLEGPRTKNGKPHIIPLSSVARSIISKIERKGVYVFPGAHGIPIGNWAKAKERLDKATGVTGWVIHDIRRTVATGLQKLGVQLPVTEAILNHTSGSRAGIVRIYQRHDYYAEKAAALEAWGAHVTALVAGRPAQVPSTGSHHGSSRRCLQPT
jgi:integrase